MQYQRDFSSVSELGDRDLLPADEYVVEISSVREAQTKSNLPLIKIRYRVVRGAYENRNVFDQIVIFPGDQSGAGITKHFLHVIGEQYEGKCIIDPLKWIKKRLTISVIIDKAYNNNKVIRHTLYEDLP